MSKAVLEGKMPAASVVLEKMSTLAMRTHARLFTEYAFSKSQYPPIFVYQMGKVASTTVCTSLNQARVKNSVFHLHFLSDDLPRHIATHKNAGFRVVPYHLILGTAVRKALLKHRDTTCKIISLTRDPIAFVISNIFQNPKLVKADIENDFGEVSAEKVGDYLNRRLSVPDEFSYQDNWFDREIKKVFGIDVFEQPFASDVGYQTYVGDSAELLLIRLEDLSSKGGRAIAEFLGLSQPLELMQRNVRSSAKGSSEYEALLKNFHLDRRLCREIYSRKLVRHFYNDEMIEGFISKWTGQ